jgi:TonB family protein
MAYDAGMLIEPADYSAWTLYSRALAEHGGSDEARAGLEMVAADLLSRGSVAVEQGRLDDAESTVQEILKVLPEHADAIQLAAMIAERRAPPPPPLAARNPVVRPEAERAARTTVERPEVAPPPPVETDPIPPLSDSFNNALASNALLTPADASASYYARQMLAARPDDARSLSARDLLVTEMLGRSRQSIEALDMDAARTWVDAAETLGGNRDAIEEGRADLLIAQVRQESAKPVPASELVVANYVAPAYPRTPLSRGIEGWVDIEFTVGEDGNTRDIVVADASHKSYFRNEAVEAVSGWRFEPRIFMGEVLTQRSYTRVAFVLEN